MQPKIPFFNLTQKNLASLLQDHHFKPIHAEAMYRHVYKKGHSDWQSCESLSPKLRQFANESFHVLSGSLLSHQESRYDQSIKFLVQWHDGLVIETVLMPEKGRLTLCLSSQVGCRQACSFCHTGRMGLSRHLETHELVAQVFLINQWLRDHAEWLEKNHFPPSMRVTHIVFMGMGEPLDNVESLTKALKIMHQPLGLDLSYNRLSVSTAGHLDGLEALWQEIPEIPIAFSLHHIDDKMRSKIMPINKIYPFQEVLDHLSQHYEKRGPRHKFFVQFTVIKGVNDGEEIACSLAEILKDRPAKVNLIPLNEIAPSRFQEPDPKGLERFRDILHAKGIRVMIRYSKGQDIAAACGQLVQEAKDLARKPLARL